MMSRFSLKGEGQSLFSIEKRMKQTSESLEFERAASLRDQIAAVQNSLQDQFVVSDTLADRDVFGFYREGDRIECVVLNIRGGKLVGRKHFR